MQTLCAECSFPVPPVPSAEDQPDPEVGGSMEGAGLPGSHCFLCCPGGERPFPQVLAFGIWLLLPFDLTDDSQLKTFLGSVSSFGFT